MEDSGQNQPLQSVGIKTMTETNTQKVRNIRLYGELGKRFGRIHKFAASSTKEAIHALCVLVPGFERFLIHSKDRGIAYACFIGKKNLKQEDLQNPVGDEDIRIAPIIAGSKRGGLLQVIAGVALVATAIIPMIGVSIAPTITGTIVGGVTGAGASFGAMGWLGTSLILGGAYQLLSPQQKGLSSKDGSQNSASYNFNGPVNTSAEGNPVPLLYGRVRIGGATVSAGIFAEDKL